MRDAPSSSWPACAAVVVLPVMMVLAASLVGSVWIRHGGHGALAPCRVTSVAGCYAVRLALSVLGSGILVGHGTHD
jgi:hypothetical protein